MEEGCPIRRIMWKEGHLITSVPGNRVLRPPPSASTTASRPLFASWTQSWHRKGRRGEERRKGGCPFYSRAVGTPSPPFLSLPFFTLPPSLFSPPSSFLLFTRDRPFAQDSEIPFDRPASQPSASVIKPRLKINHRGSIPFADRELANGERVGVRRLRREEGGIF